jgi:hypothetical protein
MTTAETLAGMLCAICAEHPEAAPFLDAMPVPLRESRPAAPRTLPVCRWLDPDHAPRAAVEAAPVVKALIDGQAALSWRQTYGAEDFGPAFLERYGWSELAGERGPIPSTTVAMGFLLLGPGIEYPSHAHEAAEIYLPLAGTALWQKGDAPFAPVPPGQPIVHDPWVPHAMRTGGEALIAAYLWRGGDLQAKSVILG